MSTVAQPQGNNHREPDREREKVLHVRIKAPLLKRLRIAAASEERALSAIVEEALERRLNRETADAA